MKNTNKKGFTVVELVIVIAVIAVLAAVLIPTFSSLVQKANESADVQAARQMNTILSTLIDGATLEQAVDALEANGFNAADMLVPISKGYAFYWYKGHNVIALVNETTNTLVFPEGDEYANFAADFAKTGDEKVLFALADGGEKYLDVTVADATELKDAIGKGTKSITLSQDVTLNEVITIPANTEIVIDFDGNGFTAKSGRPFSLADGANLTINAEGSTIYLNEHGLINVLAEADATVVVNGGTYYANYDSAIGSFIRLREGESDVDITLNNVTYIDNSEDDYITNILGFEGTFNLTVNGGSYKSACGFVCGNITVKNATINTKSAAVQIDMPNSKVEIDGCTITVGNTRENDKNPAAALAMAKNGYGEIKNCTITQTGVGGYAYVIYTSGGEIVATNNNVTADKLWTNQASATGSIGKITIDGEVVANKVNP